MNNIEQTLVNPSPTKQVFPEQRLNEDNIAPVQGQLEPIDRSGPLPLSFAQQRMWFIDQLESGNPTYNYPIYFRLTGTLNVEALTQSLNEIVCRHEVLRSHFPIVNGQPSLNIIPKLQLALPITDVSQHSEQTQWLQTYLCQEAQKPFDLANGPLIRTQLLKLSETEHSVIITLHHSIFDSWSEKILKQEITTLYTVFSTEQSHQLPPLPIQYVDYAHWQRQTLTQSTLQSQLAYWKTQLNGELPILELPTDKPRALQSSVQGATHSLLLSKSLTDALESLSHQEDTTLFMTLLAAFKALLYRYTGQTDVMVGTTVSGRDRIETEALMGAFINTLALRTSLADNPTFQTVLSQVRGTVLDAFSHQSMPFEQVVGAVQPERNQPQSPIFQTFFQLRSLSKPIQTDVGLTIETTDIDWGVAPFELTLDITESPAGLLCHFQYRTELFEASTIERMAGHFQTLLEGITTNPNQTVGTVPLLTESEQHQLLVDWNETQTDYPQEKCIHQLFEEQVERTPNAIAMIFENQQLTYQDLNIKANQLASHLQTLGVKPGKLVGIGLNRSLEMVVGLLATLKAGGAYVPLDVKFPSERLAFMVEDSDISVLVTTHEAEHYFTAVKSNVENICYLDTDFTTLTPRQGDNLPCISTAHDLAYVIYTSGSTGKPKGVEICHGSVINFLQTMAKQPGLTAQDILLSVTTLSFDIAVLELLLPLSVGARVAIASSEVASDGIRLAAMLKQFDITVMQATPATWQMLLASGWDGTPDLKMLCGGEPLPQSLADKLLERGGSLWNLYGPTEATVWATVSQIKKDVSITIGTPIDNTQVYLLDEQLNPVPVGVPGELHIGGAGLARGYLNRPKLTHQRFIPNPFDQGHTRLYKTGDLARYLPNGTIECLGRLDHQVKIRGFRMELGEIEAALTQHPNIKQTIVVAQVDAAGEKHIVAYSVATSPGMSLTPQEQRQFLQQTLPYYMVPSIFIVLDAFPLTPNGKIDRRALPTPDFSQRALDNEFVAPSNPIEEQLCQIWCSVLRQERIGIHDNFFDLGGHSLLAVKAATAITETVGQPCAVIDFFQSPTIQQLAEKLQNHQTEKQLHPCIFPIRTASKSDYPLFCIHVLGRNLSFYRPLASHMEQHTLYGLASELSGAPDAPHPQDIQSLATYYTQVVKTVQPEGPYHLIGTSFGGLIAYEIAQQLVAQGDEIRLVGLLDTYSPIQSNKYLRQRLGRHYQNIKHKGWDYVLLRLNSLLGGQRSLGLDEANEQAYEDIKPEEYEEINKGHRFAPYPGKVTLFRAQDDPDAKLGWKDLAQGGLVVHDIPGNHIGMLTDPNVRVLATHLHEILNPETPEQ